MKKINTSFDVYKLSQKGLLWSSSAAFVLILIIDHYDWINDKCFLNTGDIAFKIGKLERSIYHNLKKLKEENLITYDRGIIRLVDEE